MSKRLFALLGVGGSLILIIQCLMMHQAHAVSLDHAQAAPELTQTDPQNWINSKPLRWSDLSGEVVLLEFWAFDCWNCYNSIPWLHTLEQRYAGKNFRLISLHTPELPQEYIRKNLVQKVRQYALTNPVMIDNDYAYWNAMHNQYWPAFYLVDRHGMIRAAYVGETHAGDGNARQIERTLDALLAEK
ncbi:MAG: redoxin family protein [Stenotrophobium sp.]